MLGAWLKVQVVETGVVFTCQITDVSADGDRPTQLRRGMVLEVGWSSAYLFGISSVGEKPIRQCQVKILGVIK
jgi:hypothetical protein